jgi:hypothetical protein
MVVSQSCAGIHFTEAFVPLLADASLDFAEQPLHGFGKTADRLLLFAADDKATRTEETCENLGRLAQLRVVAADQQVLVNDTQLEVAMQDLFETQLPALLAVS